MKDLKNRIQIALEIIFSKNRLFVVTLTSEQVNDLVKENPVEGVSISHIGFTDTLVGLTICGMANCLNEEDLRKSLYKDIKTKNK